MAKGPINGNSYSSESSIDLSVMLGLFLKLHYFCHFLVNHIIFLILLVHYGGLLPRDNLNLLLRSVEFRPLFLQHHLFRNYMIIWCYLRMA